MMFWAGEDDMSKNPVLKFIAANFRVTDPAARRAVLVRLPDPATGRWFAWMTPLFLAWSWSR
jgi:hypothetical protein